MEIPRRELMFRLGGLFISLAAACGSDDADSPTVTTGSAPSGAKATPTPEPATETPTAVPPTAVLPTAEPTPTVEVPTPPPFDLANYENGGDIADLMAEVGEEKLFPTELLHTAPELPLREADLLADLFLQRFSEENPDVYPSASRESRSPARFERGFALDLLPC